MRVPAGVERRAHQYYAYGKYIGTKVLQISESEVEPCLLVSAGEGSEE